MAYDQGVANSITANQRYNMDKRINSLEKHIEKLEDQINELHVLLSDKGII